MRNARKAFAVALLMALAWAIAPVAQAQPPIRIGASLSFTGTYLAIGQNQPAADCSAILHRLGALDPDVLAAGTYFANAVRRLGKIVEFPGEPFIAYALRPLWTGSMHEVEIFVTVRNRRGELCQPRRRHSAVP